MEVEEQNKMDAKTWLWVGALVVLILTSLVVLSASQDSTEVASLLKSNSDEVAGEYDTFGGEVLVAQASDDSQPTHLFTNAQSSDPDELVHMPHTKQIYHTGDRQGAKDSR